ncbi:MAG: amino acid ABC transporter substrate-binding protein [Clostridiaceae bacterium]|nr:amino acid ABC transporter substrate-binding protein [Clostridiaceae bacterium]
MKNKKTTKVLISLMLILAMLVSVACGGNGAEDETPETDTVVEEAEAEETDADESESAAGLEGNALDDGVLDLGTNAAFPPYEFYDGDQMVGIDIDIAKAIADYLGYEVKIHDMEFSNIIASIESGKLDGGIAGMTVTADRLESVNFSNSYATGIQSIIVTKDSEIGSIDDLEGKKIGTQFGTTGDMYAQDDFGIDNVQAFDKGADAVVALLAGNVDCVIIDSAPAQSFVEADDNLQLLDTNYTEEDYAIALTKDNDTLLEEVNYALEVLTDDGTIPAIIEKYIPAK